METCQICGRELGEVLIDEHHLIPKTFKGTETITIHKICHNAIHGYFSERELKNYFNTVERILGDERMVRFVEWVKNKPSEFYVKTKDNTERKSKRRK